MSRAKPHASLYKKNLTTIPNLDALGGKNYPLRVFSSLDVKIDSLPIVRAQQLLLIAGLVLCLKSTISS